MNANNKAQAVATQLLNKHGASEHGAWLAWHEADMMVAEALRAENFKAYTHWALVSELCGKAAK